MVSGKTAHSLRLRESAKLVLLGIARFLGLFAVARWLTRKRLGILGYHGFSILDEHIVDPYLFMDTSIFAERLKWLSDKHFSVLGLEQALEMLDDGSLPNHAVVLTFDDGWYSTYREALPLLREYGFTATIYVATNYVVRRTLVANIALRYIEKKSSGQLGKLLPDIGRFEAEQSRGRTSSEFALTDCYQEEAGQETERLEAELSRVFKKMEIDFKEVKSLGVFRYMNEKELRAANQSGVDLQLHTHDHIMPDDPRSIRCQLCRNARELAKICGIVCKHVCYPSGFYTGEIVETLRRIGVVSAVTCIPGLISGKTDNLTLNRFLDGNSIPMVVFEAEMSGFLDLLRKFFQSLGI